MIDAVMRSDAIFVYPLWAVGASMLAGAIAASLVLQVFVGRLVPADLRRRHNDVTGAVISIVGVTYAVLLAFVAMLAWQDYDAATTATSREAARVVDALRMASGLADPVRGTLAADLVAYAQVVRAVEWPAQADGRVSTAAEASLARAHAAVATMHPTDIGQGNMQAALLRALAALRGARDDRLGAVGTRMPGIVWIVVVAGGALSLATTSLLGAPSRRLHHGMAVILAISGTLILVMIVALGHPFRGEFAVTSAPFQAAVAQVEGP